jgi:hypothetical protein
MNRTPVQSSRIKSIGFTNNILELEFKGGAIYAYKGVTPEIYQAFLEAPSKGKFLSTYIVPHYTSEKVAEIIREDKK